jgi:hypothetical protein
MLSAVPTRDLVLVVQGQPAPWSHGFAPGMRLCWHDASGRRR